MPIHNNRMQLNTFYIHEEFLRPNLGRFLENVPNWDIFEKRTILAEVRVSADSHGLGDHGLGAGLVIRGAAVVKSTKQGLKFWRAHCKLNKNLLVAVHLSSFVSQGARCLSRGARCLSRCTMPLSALSVVR